MDRLHKWNWIIWSSTNSVGLKPHLHCSLLLQPLNYTHFIQIALISYLIYVAHLNAQPAGSTLDRFYFSPLSTLPLCLQRCKLCFREFDISHDIFLLEKIHFFIRNLQKVGIAYLVLWYSLIAVFSYKHLKTKYVSRVVKLYHKVLCSISI